MINLSIDKFTNAVSSLHNEITKLQESGTNRLNDKSLLIEYTIALEWLLKNKIVLPHEEIILKRDRNKIYQYVYDGGSIFYYSSFYYSVSAIKSGDFAKIQNSFRKMNFDIMAMMLNIKQNIENNRDLGYSEDNCFFDRISYCNKTVCYVLIHQCRDFYNPSLYLICNLLQTLILYYNSNQRKYKTEAYNNIKMLFNTLNRY